MDNITQSLREAIQYISRLTNQVLGIYIDNGIVKEVEKYEILQDCLRIIDVGLRLFICYDNDVCVQDWLKLDQRVCHFNIQDLRSLVPIRAALEQHNLPLIFCGRMEIFLDLVQKMGVFKIVFIMKSALFNHEEKLIRQLDFSQLEELIAQKIFAGLEERLQSFLSLPFRDDYRIHILSGHRKGSLLKELLTCQGDGTMIYKNHAYHRIRTAQAFDFSAICQILKAGNERGDLNSNFLNVPNALVEKLKDFWVLSIDGEVHVCAALINIPCFRTAKIEYLSSLLPYKESSSLLEELMKHLLSMVPKGFKIILEAHRNTIWLGLSPWFSKFGFENFATRRDHLEILDKSAVFPIRIAEKKE